MSSPAYMGSRLLSGLCQPPVTRYCVQPLQKRGNREVQSSASS